MQDFELYPEEAHPNARNLLTEDFYWSFEIETGPFGSTHAYDVFYSFLEWREAHKDGSPVAFIHGYIEDIGYPELDLKETDKAALYQYANAYKADESDLSEEVIVQAMAHAKREAEGEGRTFDERKFRAILAGVKPTSGITFLADIDNLIITTGFGQLVLEGRVDRDLLSLTLTALQRELLPMLLNVYDEADRDMRKGHLHNMLDKLERLK